MIRTSLVLAFAVAVGLAGCAGDQDPTVGSSPTATATDRPAPTVASTPTADPTDTGGASQVIEVTVEGGEVDGPGRVQVELGTEVELAVTSDVDDHIHVHGYDIFQDVAAGETARLTFTADIPGVFEVELEDRALHLVDLQVGG